MAITSAIVPYQANKSTALVQPQQSLSAIVPTKKESEKKTEVTARDLRAATLRLLRKRQQRDRLEAKYYKLEKKLNEKKKAKQEEKKNESKSFLGSIGSGFRSRAQKVGGDLLGSIGKILGYLALDWLSKPENQAIVKAIVEGIGAVFKFVDWWVTGSVDNLLSGFSQFVGGDTILERVLGFFQMAAGFFGLKYFLNPQSFFKDIWKAVDFIKGGGIRKIKIFLKKLQKQGLGKAFKFAFPKLSKVVSKILGIGPKILKGIKGVIGKTGIGAFFGKITNSIIRAVGGGAGKQAIKKGVGALIKPVSGILKRVPVVGGLLSFGLNMLLGDPPDQAFVKAAGSMLGSAIGAGLGSFIFPGVGTWLGGLVGSLIGDWLGDRLYDMLKGGDAKPPTNDEMKKLELKRLEVEKAKKITGGTDRALTEEEQNQIYRQIAEAKGMSPEKVKALLEQKEITLPDDEASGDTPGAKPTVTSGDFDEKFASVLGNYEGLRLEAYKDAIHGWKVPTIGIGATYYPAGFRKTGKVQRGDTITEEEAYWIKAQHIKEHRQRLINEVGGDLYNKTPENVKVALESIVFNYGSLSGAGIKDLTKKSIASGDYTALAAHFRNNLARHNGGKNDWRRYDEAGIIETGKSKRTGVQFNKGGDRPARIVLPKQNQRTNRMDDVSMDVIQAHMLSRMGRKKTNIIITKQGDQVISHQTIVNGMLNSNTPQPVKRGI